MCQNILFYFRINCTIFYGSANCLRIGSPFPYLYIKKPLPHSCNTSSGQRSFLRLIKLYGSRKIQIFK